MIVESIALISYSLLIIVTAIEPRRSTMSAFEINRRKKNGDASAADDELREKHYDDVLAWLRILAGLMMVVFILASVSAWGWLLGVGIAVLGVIEYVALARIPFVVRWGQWLYGKAERHLLRCAHRYGRWLGFLRGVARQPSAPLPLASQEELLHLVTTADTAVLSSQEKKLIESNVTFAGKTVASNMTPRSMIDTVKEADIIGPLLLDELHRTGHSRFPVVGQDIDHVVGVLHLRDIISRTDKKAPTVATMMKTPVYYIKDTQTLGHALAAFLRVKHHLFVVVNEYRETVGVITLEDVIEAMIGRKIVDEFDAHEDLRVVAARNPRAINTPKDRRDV